MSKVSLINGHIDGTNTCVICGRDIPKGSQVCVICGNTEPRDMVEVVRCKDCKHLKYGYQCYVPLGMNLNNKGDAYVLVNPEEDFCSYGERKEVKE